MAPTELTPEALFELEVPKNIKISPDGSQVVYQLQAPFRKGKHALSSIWLADVHKEHSARQLTSGLFNDKEPQWSPDGQTIAFISDRAKQGESSAIYLIRPDGGEAYAITGGDNKKGIASFKWSPSDQFIAFLSADEESAEDKKKKDDGDDADVYGEKWEYNRIKLVHVATRVVETPSKSDEHVMECVWSRDAKMLYYIATKTPEVNSPVYHGSWFKSIGVGSRSGTMDLCHFPGWARSLVTSDSSLYFLAGVKPDRICTSKCVYKLSLPSKQWTKHSFGDNSCASGLQQVGDKAVVNVQDGLADILYTLDEVKLRQFQHELEAWDVDLGDGPHSPRIVASMSSAAAPTEVFACAFAPAAFGNEAPLQLSQHGSAVAKLCASFHASPSPFSCTASDGTLLQSILFTPTTPSSPPKPLPTIVHVHGGPYSRDTDSFGYFFGYSSHWIPYLLASGYAVLCPNYRGGSGRGDAFASHSRGGVGTKDYDDVVSITQAAISRGFVDPEKVLIAGWSQGGFLSYLSATRPTFFRFTAAIAGAGVTDWDMLTATSDAPAFEAELTGGAPWDGGGGDAHKHGSAVWHMQAVKKEDRIPVLILHGEKDERVPVSQAVAFHRGAMALGWAGVQMVVYPREGHLFEERAHVVDMLKRVARFVDAQLS